MRPTPKFTSGPWHLNSHSETDWHSTHARMGVVVDVFRSIRAKNGGMIAEVLSQSTVEPEETKANAHLISAAPDLYEALLGVIEYYEGFNPITDKRIEPYVREVKAALKKARGEA